jgi:hypothetical protein
MRREHTKGPCWRKTFRAVEAVSFDEEAVEVVLAAPGCRSCAVRKGGVALGARRRAPFGRHGRSDRDVRGSIASSPWEEKRPRRPGRFPAGLRSDADPPKRSRWRQPPSPPDQATRRPRVVRRVAAPRGVRSVRKHTRCGSAFGSSDGRDRSACALLGHAPRVNRGTRAQLARRKRLPHLDGAGSWRDGESVQRRTR